MKFEDTGINNLRMFLLTTEILQQDISHFRWIKQLNLEVGDELIVAKSRLSEPPCESIYGVQEAYIPRVNAIVTLNNCDKWAWAIFTSIHIKGRTPGYWQKYLSTRPPEVFEYKTTK